MKIIADTNVLVRAVVRDDVKQARAASRILKEAELIAVTLPCLCEFVWVLQRVYDFARQEIGEALEALVDAGNVVVNRPAVEAGLEVFYAGGDFADGLIAYEGSWLGGETFVSFDRKAVSLLVKRGQDARLLTS
ncbi:type II toxin-antitoxin system VapC family toxin [Edaphobacter aggregans]|uniref:type II toxin-antitoxin system VapC family toxin n=1 Tax=Edaphobacter aggregans TaxID=570835 RepID=UPI0005501402|nr:type II toxin-antitoxin system VapC family toxin [Edaphobacter aggregans]